MAIGTERKRGEDEARPERNSVFNRKNQRTIFRDTMLMLDTQVQITAKKKTWRIPSTPLSTTHTTTHILCESPTAQSLISFPASFFTLFLFHTLTPSVQVAHAAGVSDWQSAHTHNWQVFMFLGANGGAFLFFVATAALVYRP